MAKRIVRDDEADGGERSYSPIICESSLGENPDVRKGKVCRRPLTDLERGLPVEVRDTALKIRTPEEIPRPKSELHRELLADLKERWSICYFAMSDSIENIQKRQRTGKVFMWKKATICGFYGRGSGCVRGDECPFRHVMPETGDLSQHKIKENRYYYREIYDPVVMKILGKDTARMLEAPYKESFNTVYVGGVNSRVLEPDIRAQFRGYGEIESMRTFPEKECAVVKEGAEKAAQELRNELVVVNGQRLKLMRAGPQVPKTTYPDQQAGLLPRAVISNQPPPMHPQPPPHQDGPFYPQRIREWVHVFN